MKQEPVLPHSIFSPVSAFLREIDDTIADLYRANDVAGVRPRFSMALIALADHGPMTIKALAQACRVTHAAMSQSVKAMNEAALVKTKPGQDARSVLVELTERGHSVIAFLIAEWNATEAMIAELEAELPYPLTKVIEDIRVKLETRSLQERLGGHMVELRGK
ncbi:MarR family winged helix-turn-helix transcriptional regulator [Erwinia rhapontici]|uniref:MarR family winged helix-turn-helix transcriptional regulator n=1 Tax=Erwinia rhapontici TaxID=55212 RepID=UPI000DD09F61|nr:MarR family transcriptional regulator [Erwinia rhapontici]MBP2155780.1 DNA-binding MarR family transcriptional regulator [Erwinia rhapontici]